MDEKKEAAAEEANKRRITEDDHRPGNSGVHLREGSGDQ